MIPFNLRQSTAFLYQIQTIPLTDDFSIPYQKRPEFCHTFTKVCGRRVTILDGLKITRCDNSLSNSMTSLREIFEMITTISTAELLDTLGAADVFAYCGSNYSNQQGGITNCCA